VVLEARPQGSSTWRTPTSEAVVPVTGKVELRWTVTNVNACVPLAGEASWAASSPSAAGGTFTTVGSITANTDFAIRCRDANYLLFKYATVTVPLMNGSCNAYYDEAGTQQVATTTVGTPIWWIAKPSPASPAVGVYSYAWSGSDNINLGGTGQKVQKIYRTTGPKTASVTITNNGFPIICGPVTIYLSVNPRAKEF
jgi:hypothetical protein